MDKSFFNLNKKSKRKSIKRERKNAICLTDKEVIEIFKNFNNHKIIKINFKKKIKK